MLDSLIFSQGCVKVDRHSSNNELKAELLLKEVSEEELLKYRASHTPGLVLVANGRFFYAPISGNLTLDLGKHQCSLDGKVCHHLSALPDENGGCPKVRDLFFNSLNGRFTTLKSSKRIEKYDFIGLGYETFNLGDYENFTVCSCAHYRPEPPRPPMELNPSLLH